MTKVKTLGLGQHKDSKLLYVPREKHNKKRQTIEINADKVFSQIKLKRKQKTKISNHDSDFDSDIVSEHQQEINNVLVSEAFDSNRKMINQNMTIQTRNET